MIKKDDTFTFSGVFGEDKNKKAKKGLMMVLDEDSFSPYRQTIFENIAQLTCEVLNSFSRGKKGLLNAQKTLEKIKKSNKYLVPAVDFVSEQLNSILQNDVVYLVEDKKDIVRFIVKEALKDEKLLRFDFYQYRQALAKSFSQEDRNLFYGMCDLMCMLIQRDTKNSLLEGTNDRVRSIESLFGTMPEQLKAQVRKNKFLFKTERIRLSHRGVGNADIRPELNYALLKKMCLKTSKDIVIKNIYRAKILNSRQQTI